jgi:hypothetical protein
MMKKAKVVLASAILVAGISTSTPAAASRDGENSYQLACAILWYFGYSSCAELR